MLRRTAFLVPLLLVLFSLLSAGCSGKKEKADIGGTWVRFEFEGDRFVLLLDPSRQTYQIDFTNDHRWDVQGLYSFSNGTITFVDTAGDKRCPDMPGIYTYQRKDCMLDLALVSDSCSGRAWVINGEWMVENYQDLIEEWSQIIGADSTNGEAYFQHGRFMLATRDYKNALDDLNRAIGLGVEHAEAYAFRGFARVWESRDYEGALADYDRAIELDPQMAKAYFDRGRIKLELDDKKGACKDWEAAFELGYAGAEKLMRNHCRYILKDRYLKGKYRK